MGTKKLVVISIISILLISIATSIIGWNTRTYDSDFSEQECKRSGKYCIFEDIPNGMMYTKPSESLEGVHEFTGDVDDYVYNIYESRENYPNEIPEGRRITLKTAEFYIWNIKDYRCKSTNQTPEVIEYFSKFCRGSSRIDRCGEERRAIICDQGYLIQEVKDYNTKLYGPHDIPESIN
jgi:hypothetical protein